MDSYINENNRWDMMVQGHMQEICLSAKRGKKVLKVPPEVP